MRVRGNIATELDALRSLVSGVFDTEEVIELTEALRCEWQVGH